MSLEITFRVHVIVNSIQNVTDIEHRLSIGYEVTNLSQGRCAARGHTILATVDHEGRMLMETPREFRERIQAAAG